MDYLNAGKPIVALRTSTHAFSDDRNKKSFYAKYDWRNKDWPGGCGQQVLGETWVAHHGNHGKESTRGVINPEQKNSPILRGVTDIWGPTDVYTVSHLPKDATVLVFGQVLTGMKPTDPPSEGSKNNPMMPLIWTREHRAESGKASRILTSTIGAAVDFESEGLVLMTNDGDLTNKLTHPKFGHQKEYRVLLARRPDQEQLEAWRRGVVLEDEYKTAPVDVHFESAQGKGAWVRVIRLALTSTGKASITIVRTT